ncbi:hypothetical protein BN7_1165 [Wickerhamomyces ciferrii]|uniref:Chromatin assembly factor 1 subunit n=1 Tax=Wickerhamomyces ciferrii (strain ATCC 14091 / BCRC 22168 / CBS 111 / JCM 3599 / NBRC 0793 / NRRL Y-1031 F-60-10) TaxID=1206466 RepID=K0KJG0_WICCF|nr:uncharacterized protein BN7_1165 [Wickerhamomyces ciferrii]CCH41624.1 hypothetical protein BN7_1165 [Wickerhamomyces ciferrii]
MAATLDTMSDTLPENKASEPQYIELEDSPVKPKIQSTIDTIQQTTPQKPNFNTPAKDVLNQEQQNSNNSTPSKTPKQKQKEEERIAKLKQKELEKQEREKAKEAEKQLKEQKRLEKELERKKANEEKERIKKEKRDQLQREKEEKEKQRLKEKEEKEKQRLEEKKRKEEERLKKEEEKQKIEDEKKKAEEEKLKQKQKLQISNFFKPKSVVKSSTITDESTTKEESSNLDYSRSFHEFYLRANVKLLPLPNKIDTKSFDENLQSSKPNDLKNWFQSKHNQDNLNDIQESTTAKYIFENQLDAAPLEFKYIRFYENIRTYIGTYTKDPKLGIGRNPFLSIETPFIDWDDEQEEDEEGEGEDIDEEDDDEDDEDDEGSEEDLSDFLEDDKITNTKKRALGPLVPIVHWHETSEIDLKLEILKENVTSIDPFHNYWETITINSDGVSISEEPKPKKTKTLILERNDLEIFAKEVHNTDFTVPTMVELLKKKLPNYTKLTIENTLKAYAKKVGPKATEKKWEIDTEQLKKAMGVW